MPRRWLLSTLTVCAVRGVVALGNTKSGERFPKDATDSWLTWSKYKEATFQGVIDSQDETSGMWNGGYVGPVIATGVNLCVLPIYQK